MASISAKKLTRALHKAKTTGRAEVDLSLDGTDFVLQSLGSTDYADINEEVNDLEGERYLYEWRKGHVARSIVGIDGVDLRDCEFIEDEELAGDVMKNVRFPRHQWVKKNFVDVWGREAVEVAFRKFAETVAAAEKKSQEGVKFEIALETEEEKFRRLLQEALEASSEVPDEKVEQVFSDLGLTRKVSIKDVQEADKHLNKLTNQLEEVPPPEEPEEPEEPPPAAPVAPQATPLARRPLNTIASNVQPRQELPTTVAPPATVRRRTAELAAQEDLPEFPNAAPVAEEAPTQAEDLGGGPGIRSSTKVATSEQLERLRQSQIERRTVDIETIADQPPPTSLSQGLNPRRR